MDNKFNDILLLKLIKEGDQHAFRHLFDTYFTSLCRFMYMYVPNKPLIEEQALDIFTYIWENRVDFQIQLTFKAYLFQSARNKCLNILRTKQQTVSLEEGAMEMESPDESMLETEELSFLIQEAVSALPEKCREVFQLSRSENLSNQEIADQLNISVKTVEAQITKALKRIKDFLGDSYNFIW